MPDTSPLFATNESLIVVTSSIPLKIVLCKYWIFEIGLYINFLHLSVQLLFKLPQLIKSYEKVIYKIRKSYAEK